MVRVHESVSGNEQYGVSFNLDSWDQFDSYVRTLAAKRGRFTYHDHTECRADSGKIRYVLIHGDNGNERLFLHASKPEYHADCEYCRQRLDTTAGNGR
jgi:hypothetical protein